MGDRTNGGGDLRRANARRMRRGADRKEAEAQDARRRADELDAAWDADYPAVSKQES